MRTALLVLLALPGVAGAPVLVAVVPDLPGSAAGDEGFAVGCAQACDLAGFSVTDGEDAWAFPAGVTVEAGRTLWVVGNRTHWEAHGGPGPVLEASGLPR